MRISSRFRGHSVLEMMIVCTLISLVTAVIATLFSKGREIYQHGEAHIEMQRDGRYLVSRATPILSSMFNADLPTANPIREPGLYESAPEVIFDTTEDYLSPDYPSRTTSATEATSVADLRRYTYRIRFVDPTISANAADQNRGHVVLEKLTVAAGPTYYVSLPIEDHTRVIMRAKEGQEISTEPDSAFTFTRVRRNMIRLSFSTVTSVRGASKTNEGLEIKEDFRVAFNLPTD